MIFTLCIFTGWTQEPQTGSGNLASKLLLLETKAKQIKAVQEEILLKQSEIRKELGELKIWIRRNRG